MIRVACLNCKSNFRVPLEGAGRKIACPKCAEPLLVPVIESPVEFVPPVRFEPVAGPRKKRLRLRLGDLVEKWWPLSFVVVGCLCWFFFAFYPTNAGQLLAYPSMILTTIGLTFLLKRKGRSPRAYWLAIVGGAVVIVLWGRNDVVKYRYERVNEDFQTKVIRIDTHWRWSGKPKERFILSLPLPNQRFPTEEWSASGPFTDTGKPHGKWLTFEPKKVITEFYWYGEEVSEAEWHKLNK